MGNIPLSAAFGYLLYLAAGDALTSIVWSREVQPRGVERIGLAISLGIGSVSLFLFWGSLIAPGSVNLWWAVLPTVGLIGLRGLIVRRVPPAAAEQDDRCSSRSWLPIPQLGVVVGSVLISIEVLYCTILTITGGFGWDAFAIWNHKARLAFVSGGMPLDHLTDLSRQWSHLDYPWLVPLGQALFYYIDGHFAKGLGKALFPAFYAALLLLCFANLRRVASELFATTFVVLLGIYPSLVSWTASGNADIAVSLYSTGSVIYLYRWMSKRSTATLVCSMILAGLAAWSKNEGLVVLVFQIGVLLLLSLRGTPPVRLSDSALAIGVAVVIVGPWLGLQLVYQVPHNDYVSPSLPTVLNQADRIPVIVERTIVELATWRRWGLLWPLFACLAIWGTVPLKGRDAGAEWRARYLVLSVIIPFAVLDSGYVLSRWQPYTAHIDTSLERLVAQQAPVAQLTIAVILSDISRRACSKQPRACRSLGTQQDT